MTSSKHSPHPWRRFLAFAAAVSAIGLIAVVLWLILGYFDKQRLGGDLLDRLPALPHTEGWPEAFSEALSDAHA